MLRTSLPPPPWRPVSLVLLLPALLLAGACDDVTDPSPVPSAVRMAGDSVHLFTGEAAALAAVALDAKGNALPGVPLSWSSSDTAVAVVDSAGRVVGLRPGRAVVTAEARGGAGARARMAVGVTRRPDRLEMSRDTFVFRAPGKECMERVEALRYDRQGQRLPIPRSLTFSVENAAVAAYERLLGGTDALYAVRLYGTGPGETRLVATSPDGYADTAVVRVLPGTPARVRAEPVFRTLVVGDTLQLSAQLLNECGGPVPGQSLTFASRNPAVVEVSPAGRAVVRGPGSTYVRTTWNAFADSVLVMAWEYRLLPADTTAFVGDTLTYRTYVTYAAGDTRPVSDLPSSSDTTVARVLGTQTAMEQRVVAVREGEARLTSRAPGQPTARLRVTRRP